MREGTPLLHHAHEIINGERQHDYGPPQESFGRIAAMWSAYLGIPVSPHDVDNLMILLKVCRAKQGFHYDSYLDIAGYAGLSEMLDEPKLLEVTADTRFRDCWRDMLEKLTKYDTDGRSATNVAALLRSMDEIAHFHGALLEEPDGS